MITLINKHAWRTQAAWANMLDKVEVTIKSCPPSPGSLGEHSSYKAYTLSPAWRVLTNDYKCDECEEQSDIDNLLVFVSKHHME